MSPAGRHALRTALTVLAELLANPLDRPEARIAAVRAALAGLDGEGEGRGMAPDAPWRGARDVGDGIAVRDGGAAPGGRPGGPVAGNGKRGNGP